MRYLRNRKAARRPRGPLLVVFLGLSLALAAGLAYQAVDAVLSDRETTESVLHDYARLAAWEFARRLETGLGGVMWPAFEPLRELPAPRPEEPLPFVEAIASQVGEICRCQGVDPPSFFFRLDRSSGALSVSPDTVRPSDGLREVLTERIEPASTWSSTPHCAIGPARSARSTGSR